MLTLQWLLTGAALLLAAGALVRAKRLAKRLDRLTESYWELRYEHGQLRTRVGKFDSEQTSVPDDPGRQTGATAFVPLSSLRR